MRSFRRRGVKCLSCVAVYDIVALASTRCGCATRSVLPSASVPPSIFLDEDILYGRTVTVMEPTILTTASSALHSSRVTSKTMNPVDSKGESPTPQLQQQQQQQEQYQMSSSNSSTAYGLGGLSNTPTNHATVASWATALALFQDWQHAQGGPSPPPPSASSEGSFSSTLVSSLDLPSLLQQQQQVNRLLREMHRAVRAHPYAMVAHQRFLWEQLEALVEGTLGSWHALSSSSSSSLCLDAKHGRTVALLQEAVVQTAVLQATIALLLRTADGERDDHMVSRAATVLRRALTATHSEESIAEGLRLDKKGAVVPVQPMESINNRNNNDKNTTSWWSRHGWSLLLAASSTEQQAGKQRLATASEVRNKNGARRVAMQVLHEGTSAYVATGHGVLRESRCLQLDIAAVLWLYGRRRSSSRDEEGLRQLLGALYPLLPARTVREVWGLELDAISSRNFTSASSENDRSIPPLTLMEAESLVSQLRHSTAYDASSSSSSTNRMVDGFSGEKEDPLLRPSLFETLRLPQLCEDVCLSYVRMSRGKGTESARPPSDAIWNYCRTSTLVQGLHSRCLSWSDVSRILGHGGGRRDAMSHTILSQSLFPVSSSSPEAAERKRALQEAVGDGELLSIGLAPHHQGQKVQRHDRTSLQTLHFHPSTWRDAIALAMRDLSAEAVQLDEEDPVRGSWRQQLPAAIRLCANAGKYAMSERLYDEYRIGTAATGLSMEAMAGFAESLKSRGAWWRALDVLEGVGRAQIATSPVDQYLLEATLTRTAALLSNSRRWCEALRLVQSLRQSDALLGQREAEAVGSAVPDTVLQYALWSLSAAPSTHWQAALAVLLNPPPASSLSQRPYVPHSWVLPLLGRHHPKQCVAVCAAERSSISQYATLFATLRGLEASGSWRHMLELVTMTDALRKHSNLVWHSYCRALLHTNEPIGAAQLNLVPSQVLRKAPTVLRLAMKVADRHCLHRALADYLQTIEKPIEKGLQTTATGVGMGHVAECQRHLLWKAQGGDVGQAERPKLTLRDPSILHDRLSSALSFRDGSVKYILSPSQQRKLTSLYHGDVKRFVQRELNLPPSCIGRVGRSRPSSSDSSVSFLVLHSLFRSEEMASSSSSVEAIASLVIHRCPVTEATVLMKPAGMSVTLLAAMINRMRFGGAAAESMPQQVIGEVDHSAVPIEPVMSFPVGASGAVVLFPTTCSPLRSVCVQVRCLLALHPLAKEDVDPLTLDPQQTPSLHTTQFYQRLRMQLLHVSPRPDGAFLWIVEAVFEPEDHHHHSSDVEPVGSDWNRLSELLAVEGWGYVGDPGNHFVESAAQRSQEDLGTLLFVREVTVSIAEEGKAARTMQCSVAIPDRWWEQGLLAPETQTLMTTTQ